MERYNKTSRLFPNHLMGACAIGAACVYNLLKNSGFEPFFIKGLYKWEKHNYYDEHCWVEVNQYIVDITATQFGFTSSVLIFNRYNALGKRFIAKKAFAADLIEISKDFYDWPLHQQFSPKIVQEVLDC